MSDLVYFTMSSEDALAKIKELEPYLNNEDRITAICKIEEGGGDYDKVSLPALQQLLDNLEVDIDRASIFKDLGGSQGNGTDVLIDVIDKLNKLL